MRMCHNRSSYHGITAVKRVKDDCFHPLFFLTYPLEKNTTSFVTISSIRITPEACIAEKIMTDLSWLKVVSVVTLHMA